MITAKIATAKTDYISGRSMTENIDRFYSWKCIRVCTKLLENIKIIFANNVISISP
jgi:hypothetical protein